jgi:UDP-glucuronate 4-epimerase
MSLLITGNEGFIGCHLSEELKKRSIKFVGYDLRSNFDIRDKYQLDEFFEKNQVTEVIHLAALAGVRRSKLYPEDYAATNILGTQNIVDCCERNGVKRIIFYSSSSVFGNQEKLPVTEESEKNPISFYGISKLAGEKIVNNFSGQTVIIRPFTVYGEEGRKDEVVFKWLEQIRNGLPITVYDVDSFRGYVYVKDLVRATADLIEKDWDWQHNDFNLGGSEEIRLGEILEIFEYEYKRIFKKELEVKLLERQKEDVFQQYTSLKKINEYIKFNPSPKFKENARKIVREGLKEIRFNS